MGERGGGILRIPKGYYRLSQPLVHTKGVKIIGDGWTYNPGIVGATNYSLPFNYSGSVLIFDANVAGIRFVDYTDNLANAADYEFQSSINSCLEDIALYGGGGTDITAHGIDARTLVNLRNVSVRNFAGNGVQILAYTSGAHPYGNSSLSKFDHVLSWVNGLHGFYIEGSDANICTFISCGASSNGGVGYLETSLIGNTYIGCHAAGNNRSYGASTPQRTKVIADWAGLSDYFAGSYVAVSSAGAENAYFGCYTEAASQGGLAEITGNSGVFGGLLSEASNHTTSSRGSYRFHGTTTIYNQLTDALLDMSPVGGTFSHIQMKGAAGALASGMDILAGGASGYLSADSLVVRNAAQAVTYGTFNSGGLNLGSGKVLSVNGTQVVGPRVTGWTAATNTKSKATFDTTSVTLPNLAARVGQLIDDLIAHGIIGA